MTGPSRARRIPWAALASGFAAALALAVSTYNVYLQRQQIRAQVWPRLEWSQINVDGFVYQLHNSGVGPADLRTVGVTVDGAPVASWAVALDRVTGVRGGYRTGGLSGRVLGPGATIEALRITDEAAARVFEAQAQRIAVELCYCSTLGDCWQHHGGRSTEAVTDCPASAATFAQ
jgi:hypothetical protein